MFHKDPTAIKQLSFEYVIAYKSTMKHQVLQISFVTNVCVVYLNFLGDNDANFLRVAMTLILQYRNCHETSFYTYWNSTYCSNILLSFLLHVRSHYFVQYDYVYHDYY